METKKTSLIIPHYNNLIKLNGLCTNIMEWTQYPDQIIIVDTSDEQIDISLEFKNFCKEKKININIIYRAKTFPGHARNIGIMNSSNYYLAFLDINTLPSKNWFFHTINSFKDKNIMGVWGSTRYVVSNYKEKIMRAASFGVLPLITIPGSIFKRELFQSVGLFVESVRSGEDSDLISRINLHNLNLKKGVSIIEYIGLEEYGFTSIVKKWYRNYYSCSILPVTNTQRNIYFYGLIAIFLMGAYQWNNFMAEWEEGSKLYIPYITKISLIIVFSLFLIARGIIIPIKKGSSFLFVIFFNFIVIGILSFFLDFAKTLGFSHRKIVKLFKLN